MPLLCSFRIRMRSSGVSARIGGRPILFPFRRASPRPALTRSPINARSNCAIAPNIWNTSSPDGSDVSIASVADTKSIPNFRNSSSADTSCRNDLANRSNFQTSTTSNFLFRVSRSSSSSQVVPPMRRKSRGPCRPAVPSSSDSSRTA